MLTNEETNLIGCCGLYCGLCPRYQSGAPGRCHGCKTFTFVTSCKIRNCCVKRKGLTTCAECDDFPCEKNNPETHQYEYFVTNKVCIPNLYRIKEVGLEIWLGEQKERQLILENLLAEYNEGRSKSFYCTATALMPVSLIEKAINEAREIIANNQINESDIKSKARLLKSTIQDLASKSDIDLKLRKRPK